MLHFVVVLKLFEKISICPGTFLKDTNLPGGSFVLPFCIAIYRYQLIVKVEGGVMHCKTLFNQIFRKCLYQVMIIAVVPNVSVFDIFNCFNVHGNVLLLHLLEIE